MKKIQYKLSDKHISAKEEIISTLNDLFGVTCRELHEISDGSCILEITLTDSSDDDVFLLGAIVGTIKSKHITLNS